MRLPFEQETIFSVKPSASFGQPEDPGPPPEAPGIYLLRQGIPLIVTEPWVYFLAPVEFSASYTSFNAVTSILRSRANSWGDNLLWFCPLIKGFLRGRPSPSDLESAVSFTFPLQRRAAMRIMHTGSPHPTFRERRAKWPR